jgi:hypothetical protein
MAHPQALFRPKETSMQKKLTHLLIITILLVPSLLLPHQAHACSCYTPPFWREWEQAEAVFIGTVAHIEYSPPAEFMTSGDPITYTVQVHTMLKGANVPQLQVGSTIESCSADFREGERYIVYAHRYAEGLKTYSCNYNHPAGTVRPYQRDILNTVQRVWSGLGLRAWEILY